MSIHIPLFCVFMITYACLNFIAGSWCQSRPGSGLYLTSCYSSDRQEITTGPVPWHGSRISRGPLVVHINTLKSEQMVPLILVSSRGPLVVHINTLKSEQMVDTLLMIFSGSLKQKSLYFNSNFIEVLALVAQWFVYEQSLLESMAIQFIGTYTYQQASMS